MSRFQQILALSMAFFVLLMLTALFHDKGILTVFRLQDQMTEMEKNNKKLGVANIKILKEIEALKSNPLAIEKISREKLNLVKPGETVYQIVKKKSPEQSLQVSEAPPFLKRPVSLPATSPLKK